MGAIKDRSVTTLEDCLNYARLDSPEDELTEKVLNRVLTGIKELGDFICNNLFVQEDSDGEPVLDDNYAMTEVDIPMLVEVWVMRKFVSLTEYRISGKNNITLSDIGAIVPDKRDFAELQPYIKYCNQV